MNNNEQQDVTPILQVLDSFINGQTPINYEDLIFILYSNFFLVEQPDQRVSDKLNSILSNLFLFDNSQNENNCQCDRPREINRGYREEHFDSELNANRPPSCNRGIRRGHSLIPDNDITNFFIKYKILYPQIDFI